MDTNLSLALKIAGGLLMALIIISSITLLFSNINPSQQQLDDIQALEQTVDFNKEYEVYNKQLMLGTDIISLINKVYSNNLSYIEAYGYTEDLVNNYLVDIEFPEVTVDQNIEIKKIELNEDINKYIEIPISVDELSEDSIDDIKLGLDMDEDPVDNYPEISIGGDSLIIDNAGSDYLNKDVNYHLIIEQSRNDLKRTTKNSSIDNINFLPEDVEWYIATLETYVYDLKTKKFRCTDVRYSEITGRIIHLTFEEVLE